MSSIPKMIDCEPQTIPKNPTFTFGPNKNCLQVLSACVAISSAQLVGYPNGAVVPADTPAVAAAKAAFYHAGGAIHPVAGIAHAPVVYAAGPLVSHANGAVVPADTPDVVAARAAHAAAGGAVHPVAAVPYAYLHHGLVAHPNGAVVPAEPADVVAARQAHLAAHASA